MGSEFIFRRPWNALVFNFLRWFAFLGCMMLLGSALSSLDSSIFFSELYRDLWHPLSMAQFVFVVTIAIGFAGVREIKVSNGVISWRRLWGRNYRVNMGDVLSVETTRRNGQLIRVCFELRLRVWLFSWAMHQTGSLSLDSKTFGNLDSIEHVIEDLVRHLAVDRAAMQSMTGAPNAAEAPPRV